MAMESARTCMEKDTNACVIQDGPTLTAVQILMDVSANLVLTMVAVQISRTVLNASVLIDGLGKHVVG